MQVMRGGGTGVLQPISLDELKEEIGARQLDGIIIADDCMSYFTKNMVQLFKFHSVPMVGVVGVIYPFVVQTPADVVHWLDPDKDYISYVETHIISGCNLNCKGCGHFSPLFGKNDFYDLNQFRRDIRTLSEKLDLITFRLLGGEPFIKKDLEEYIKIARHYFPKTNIRIVTNALPIPSLPQSLLDSLRKNKICIDISLYAPTQKIIGEIKNTLDRSGIVYNNSALVDKHSKVIETFGRRLKLKGTSDPMRALTNCGSQNCRFLRNGKLYKCPLDALIYKYAETFGLDNFPASVGLDIYAPNFVSLLRQLDQHNPIPLCAWCSEKGEQFKWTAPSARVMEDWLVEAQ